MKNLTPAKFYLPGLFLLVLGVGNLSVGLSKEGQYEEVLVALAQEQPIPIVAPSPLQRIQQSQQLAEKNYQRQLVAQSRKDFYALVALGGKLMLGISLILLCAAATIATTLHLPMKGGDSVPTIH